MNDVELQAILARNPDISVDATSIKTKPKVEISGQSHLENKFANIWRVLGGPGMEREYRFHHKRRWRFDFAHPQSRVAVEIEGGTWTSGRHVRASGYSADCEKYNMAQVLGWRVFRLTSDMLAKGQASKHLEPIIQLIKEDMNQ